MKIQVDQARCMGHARCYAMAPQLFTLDEDGYVAIDELLVPPDQIDAARDGEAACPERAISLVD